MARQLHMATPMELRSRVSSLLIHLAVIAAILLLPQTRFDPQSPIAEIIRPMKLIAPSLAAPPRIITGGGGQFDRRPATRGDIPQIIRPIFIPPTPQIVEQPKLIVDSGVQHDTVLPRIDLPRIGDPLSGISSGPPSGGRGGRTGIGDGDGPAYGDGKGPNPGSGFRQVLGAAPPVLIHKVEPEYTDEARKARYQGSVLLAVDIDAKGTVVNVRVIRALGLGLDERAIEAVRRWRFKPAAKDGRPIDFPAAIEVSFRLL